VSCNAQEPVSGEELYQIFLRVIVHISVIKPVKLLANPECRATICGNCYGGIGRNAIRNLHGKPFGESFEVTDVLQDASKDRNIEATIAEIGKGSLIEIADDGSRAAIHKVRRHVGAAWV
jgi:hypothetical protein